jgi:hypothetical protein
MAFNLVRNSRVLFTTNIDIATGTVNATGFTTANTQEIQVLDGFSFTQATQAETITLNEAGDAPVRGQQSFNTSQSAAEFSMSTYFRPDLIGGLVNCEEKVLWNALMGVAPLGASPIVLDTLTGATRTTTASNRITLVGTAITDFADIAVGEVFTFQGFEGSTAAEWNTPATLVSASATSIVADYITAPSVAAGTTAVVTGDNVTAVKSAWSDHEAVSPAPAYGLATFAASNKNQLQPFGLIFLTDTVAYALDNAALGQASVDFALDAIATVAWTGNASALRQLAATTISTAADPVLAGGLTGTAKGRNLTAHYLANKLSTIKLVSNIEGIGGVEYKLALTGGNITFNNNITYLVPANLGVVNLPITYFTGTRAISGNVTAYLRTGSGNTTATLLANMLANISTAVAPQFALEIAIGGKNNGTRVEVDIGGAMLGIPTVDSAAVISTNITFTAQGYLPTTSTGVFSLENTNEASIRYYSL